MTLLIQRASDIDLSAPIKIAECNVRQFLPYGAYLTDGGEIVLFNRGYRPMFRRDKDGIVHPDKRGRWVEGIRAHVFFYSDATPSETEVMHRCQIIMARWSAVAGVRGRATRGWLLPKRWIHNRLGP
jgi:hypothetical protein